ncbi:hypothetical protein DB346_09830 [Verrucomicrobia bacterium LW23]|nr:hypothetical protein DB346_09830 [Verrucomicrobia bacterium LW23]
MKINFPENTTAKSILEKHPAPRGATHFRYTEGKCKPVIDSIKKIDVLAGCQGNLEYGKVTFEGRGRHAKIVDFTPIAPAAEVAEAAELPAEPAPAPVTPPADPQLTDTEIPQPAHSDEVDAAPDAALASPPADQASTAPATPKPATSPKGRKNQIFGFSACAVAKALGAAGVKYPEADSIFRAHEIVMPKASLSVQLGFGRRPATWERHGKPADLTPQQIAELRAMAPATVTA